MAKAPDHQKLSAKNRSTLDYLLIEKANHAEWIVTISFYEALHHVEAMFDILENKHYSCHEYRNERLKSDVKLDRVNEPYSQLYHESQVARYMQGSTVEYVRRFNSVHDLEQLVVRNWLHKVKTEAANVISAAMAAKTKSPATSPRKPGSKS